MGRRSLLSVAVMAFMLLAASGALASGGSRSRPSTYLKGNQEVSITTNQRVDPITINTAAGPHATAVTTADINIDQSAVNRVEQKQILLGGTLFGRNLLMGGPASSPAPTPAPTPAPYSDGGAVAISTQIGSQTNNQVATASSTQTTGSGYGGWNEAYNTNTQVNNQAFTQTANVRAKRIARIRTGRNLLSGGSSPAPAPEPVPYPVPVLTPVLVPTRVPSFEPTGAVGINTQIGHQASHQDATATSTQTTGHGKEGYNYAENSNDQRSTQNFNQDATVRARKGGRVRTGRNLLNRSYGPVGTGGAYANVNQIGTITSNQVATISPIQTISGGKDNTNVALGTINQESTQTLTQNAYVDAINKVSFFRGRTPRRN